MHILTILKAPVAGLPWRVGCCLVGSSLPFRIGERRFRMSVHSPLASPPTRMPVLGLSHASFIWGIVMRELIVSLGCLWVSRGTRSCGDFSIASTLCQNDTRNECAKRYLNKATKQCFRFKNGLGVEEAVRRNSAPRQTAAVCATVAIAWNRCWVTAA